MRAYARPISGLYNRLLARLATACVLGASHGRAQPLPGRRGERRADRCSSRSARGYMARTVDGRPAAARLNSLTTLAVMRPLDGITVVSLEQAVAAPFATRQLADLGARVIKVERPGDGDFARAYDRSVLGQSSQFIWLNRSKESLTLDLKSAGGLEVLHRLLARADVL